MIIHIGWVGPIPIDNVGSFCNAEIDYGIYQIYGTHHIYGPGVLLYIGKAEIQTFDKRISQQMSDWRFHSDPKTLQCYCGRLIGKELPSNFDEWKRRISLAESLLIFSHAPAYNSSNLNSLPPQHSNDKNDDICVYNWGEYKSLCPEVSYDRWSSKFDAIKNDDYYSTKKISHSRGDMSN